VIGILASVLLLLGGFLAWPFALGWFMHLTGAGLIAAVAFSTFWYYGVLYWGTWYHARKVMVLMEKSDDAKD